MVIPLVTVFLYSKSNSVIKQVILKIFQVALSERKFIKAIKNKVLVFILVFERMNVF
ncbi:hypothetical protein PPIS_a2037 [Pseudoalteromonas piscicida]|uniref:Uncharacterized protein n=1 Tax=Pseudoalteromonas piscicida TaxID=43662 RepID=A0ABM6NEB9_PSEO7|nr:hypothetical protein PPIS_a2037 [Pseudoalteromonas piscicida]